MPNRIIKESINESRTLSEVSIFAEDLYKRLITYADDYGRFNADTAIMIARLYPRELEYISQTDIVDALIELAGVGKIIFYTARIFHSMKPHAGVFGYFPNWQEHQRVRESKKKCPEPQELGVNDWYLRRFVPIDMKVQIIENDRFKCRICGKFVTTCKDAKKFVKLGSGTYNIDHIIPVQQGGRATLENLRLTCPECNKSRKRSFTFDEILEFTIGEKVICENPPKVAARSGEFLLESNPNPNPIRIQSERDRQSEPAIPSPYNDIMNLYNEICPSFPKIITINGNRRTTLKNLLKTYTADEVKKVFEKAEQSDFLKGKSDRGWKASFDWIIKPANFIKILEGNYDNKNGAYAAEKNYSHPTDFITGG
ncbi:MAG: HNH endonuclease signature motif containing protein [Bacilli bacterium]